MTPVIAVTTSQGDPVASAPVHTGVNNRAPVYHVAKPVATPAASPVAAPSSTPFVAAPVIAPPPRSMDSIMEAFVEERRLKDAEHREAMQRQAAIVAAAAAAAAADMAETEAAYNAYCIAQEADVAQKRQAEAESARLALVEQARLQREVKAQQDAAAASAATTAAAAAAAENQRRIQMQTAAATA